MKQLIKRYKLLIVFLAFIFLLLPSALIKESISVRSLVVTAIGVDKSDDQYEICAKIIIPKQGSVFNESFEVISATGKNLREAATNLGMQAGKTILFGHCSIIALNQEIMEENIVDLLEYLTREHNVSQSCQVVAVNKSAVKLLKISKDLNSSYNMDLLHMISYDYKNVNGNVTTIGTIFSNYLSMHKSSAIASIEIISDEDYGIESSPNESAQSSSGSGGEMGGEMGGNSGGGSSGSASSEGEGQNKDSVVSNLGDLMLIYDAKKVGIFNHEYLEGIAWSSKSVKNIDFQILNFSDEEKGLDNVDFYLETTNKLVFPTYAFENDVPVITYNIFASASITNVGNNNNNEELYKLYKDFFTNKLKQECVKHIKNEVNKSYSKLKEYGVDATKIFEEFDRFHHFKLQKYLNKYPSTREAYKDIIIKTNVVITAD